MFPSSFQTFHFFQKKRDALLFQASSGVRKYFVKIFFTKDPTLLEAIHDEYETLSMLSHPGIPIYYGLNEHYHLPDHPDDCIAMCIADCTPSHPLALYNLPESSLLQVILQVGELLSWLLANGILYTDLNPSNLLVDVENGTPRVTLVDFTCCYYFLRNPSPSYRLRFSYDLNPALKGQQLLIQELSFLLHELMTASPDSAFSSRLYTLLETGLHPSSSLSLEKYLFLIKELII